MSTICFGEILWDILPNEKVPGGAPMNVCYHLTQLGQSASLISKIGADDNGQSLMEFLTQNKLDTAFIQTDNIQPTGTVIAQQTGNEMAYQIVQPVAWDFINCTQTLLDEVSHADYFISGSLVARSELSRNTLFKLMNIAQTKVIDINLRPPHFTKETIEALLTKADIVKLNNHELALIAGWYSHVHDFEMQILQLSKRFSLPTIIVTKGDAGASIFFEDSFFNHSGFKVQVQDTIGSGDAFLAGFLSKYITGSNPEEALSFACKMGAFIASQKGACPNYDGTSVAQLFDNI